MLLQNIFVRGVHARWLRTRAFCVRGCKSSLAIKMRLWTLNAIGDVVHHLRRVASLVSAQLLLSKVAFAHMPFIFQYVCRYHEVSTK